MCILMEKNKENSLKGLPNLMALPPQSSFLLRKRPQREFHSFPPHDVLKVVKCVDRKQRGWQGGRGRGASVEWHQGFSLGNTALVGDDDGDGDNCRTFGAVDVCVLRNGERAERVQT